MLDNNLQNSGVSYLTNNLKIYLFDGFLEVIIAVFSIILIYKIIITLHETVADILEVQGTNRLDSAIESMKNDAAGWGAKI